jgi:hypothetical protein
VKALRQKERWDETQFTTKIDGKTILGQSYYVCKISFAVPHLMPSHAETGRSGAHNRLTLRITLLYDSF